MGGCAPVKFQTGSQATTFFPLNEDQVNDMVSGRAAFVTWGVVTNRDIFGRKWETKFRYFTGGARSFTNDDIGMSSHDRGNDAT